MQTPDSNFYSSFVRELGNLSKMKLFQTFTNYTTSRLYFWCSRWYFSDKLKMCTQTANIMSNNLFQLKYKNYSIALLFKVFFLDKSCGGENKTEVWQFRNNTKHIVIFFSMKNSHLQTGWRILICEKASDNTETTTHTVLSLDFNKCLHRKPKQL